MGKSYRHLLRIWEKQSCETRSCLEITQGQMATTPISTILSLMWLGCPLMKTQPNVWWRCSLVLPAGTKPHTIAPPCCWLLQVANRWKGRLWCYGDQLTLSEGPPTAYSEALTPGPYILKAKKSADSAFRSQNICGKKCINRDKSARINHQNHKNLVSMGIFVENIRCLNVLSKI